MKNTTVLTSLLFPSLLGSGNFSTKFPSPAIDVVRADTAVIEDSAVEDHSTFPFNTFLLSSNPSVQEYYSMTPFPPSYSLEMMIAASRRFFLGPSFQPLTRHKSTSTKSTAKKKDRKTRSAAAPSSRSSQPQKQKTGNSIPLPPDKKQSLYPLTAEREKIITKTLELQNLLEKYVKASEKATLGPNLKNLRSAVEKLKKMSDKVKQMEAEKLIAAPAKSSQAGSTSKALVKTTPTVTNTVPQKKNDDRVPLLTEQASLKFLDKIPSSIKKPKKVSDKVKQDDQVPLLSKQGFRKFLENISPVIKKPKKMSDKVKQMELEAQAYTEIPAQSGSTSNTSEFEAPANAETSAQSDSTTDTIVPEAPANAEPPFDSHATANALGKAARAVIKNTNILALTKKRPILHAEASKIVTVPQNKNDDPVPFLGEQALFEHVDQMKASKQSVLSEPDDNCDNCPPLAITLDEDHRQWTVPACAPLGKKPIPNDSTTVDQLFNECMGELRKKFINGNSNMHFTEIAKNMQALKNPLERRFLAMTLTPFGETRKELKGDGPQAQRDRYKNIMRLIDNRVDLTNKHKKRQLTALDAVLTRYQFSCYNNNDPNRPVMIADYYSSPSNRNNTSAKSMKNAVQAYIQYENSGKQAPDIKDPNIVFMLSKRQTYSSGWPGVVHHKPQSPTASDRDHNYYHWNVLNTAYDERNRPGTGVFFCGLPSLSGQGTGAISCCPHINTW